MNNRIKLFAVLITGIVLGFIALFVIIQSEQTGISVGLTTVPGDTQLVFKDSSGKTYQSKGKGSIRLPAGEYSVTGSKEGFKERSLKLIVKQDGQKFVVPLEAESGEAKEWAEKNRKKYLEAESIAGEESQKAGEIFRSSNPIIGKLPYTQGFYRIDYGQDGDTVVLYITADQPVGRVVALSTIRDWGFETADYDIRFNKFDNPFKVGDENE